MSLLVLKGRYEAQLPPTQSPQGRRRHRNIRKYKANPPLLCSDTGNLTAMPGSSNEWGRHTCTKTERSLDLPLLLDCMLQTYQLRPTASVQVRKGSRPKRRTCWNDAGGVISGRTDLIPFILLAARIKVSVGRQAYLINTYLWE